MTDDDKWSFVSSMLNDMQKNSDAFAAATDGLLIAPESPLITAQYRSEHSLINTLSFLVGDHFDSISWFVYECDYGREAKEAGCGGDMKLIDTHDRLRWLIELDCECEI